MKSKRRRSIQGTNAVQTVTLYTETLKFSNKLKFQNSKVCLFLIIIFLFKTTYKFLLKFDKDDLYF